MNQAAPYSIQVCEDPDKPKLWTTVATAGEPDELKQVALVAMVRHSSARVRLCDHQLNKIIRFGNCGPGSRLDRWECALAKLGGTKRRRAPPDVLVLKRHLASKSRHEVAAHFGVSVWTVDKWRRSHGLGKGGLPKLWPPSTEDLKAAYEQLRSSTKIAEVYGVDPSTVTRYMAKHGIKRRNRGHNKEALVLPPCEELAERYAKLGSTRALAKAYGVSLGTIRKWPIEHNIPMNRPHCHTTPRRTLE